MIHYRSYRSAKRASSRYIVEHKLHDRVGALDNWQCCYCGRALQTKPMPNKRGITLDHVQPLVLVVHLPIPLINCEINLVSACLRCNTKMGAKPAKERMLRYGRFNKAKARGDEVLPAIYFASAEQCQGLLSMWHTQPYIGTDQLLPADSYKAQGLELITRNSSIRLRKVSKSRF